jgi:hypothetical protein
MTTQHVQHDRGCNSPNWSRSASVGVLTSTPVDKHHKRVSSHVRAQPRRCTLMDVQQRSQMFSRVGLARLPAPRACSGWVTTATYPSDVAIGNVREHLLTSLASEMVAWGILQVELVPR